MVSDLERELASSWTRGVILIETGPGPGDQGTLRANAEASALVLGYVAFVDPTGPGVEPLLDSLIADPKCVGVRFRFEGLPAAGRDEAAILAAARSVNNRGLALELLVTPDDLEFVRTLARQLPPLRWIVDHVAKPDLRHRSDRALWSSGIRALARDTNVAIKLSVSPRAADLHWLGNRGRGGWTAAEARPFLSECLEAFGPDRVLWGSDWPVSALGGTYASAADVVADALGALDPDAEARIFAGTARRIYGLGS
jgi:L-fuconolactonase